MTQYNDTDIQRAYDFACEYLCDEETAAMICDSVGVYGSDTLLVSADEWNNDSELREWYDCIIGEDVSLDYFIIRQR